MKFSCCIEMIFTEMPFYERIHLAKAAGFDCIEFWRWEDKDISAIRCALDETGMEVGIFQGNTQGRMTDPADHDQYIEGVIKSADIANQLGAKHLFLMSELLAEDRSVLASDRTYTEAEKYEASCSVLQALGPVARKSGITFVIEPLNTMVDHCGYSLSHSQPAFDLVRRIGQPGIRVLYDAYHMQIMEGNLINTICRNIDAIGYFHIADVPGRHEPGTGEIQYANVLAALGDSGYDGVIGFEFSPLNSDICMLQNLLAQYRSILQKG